MKSVPIAPTAVAVDPPGSIGPSKDRRTSEEARRQIIDAVRAYVSRHGFRDLTVEKLSQCTAIRRSDFYDSFGSIHELAAVFILELSSKILTASSAWFDDNADPIRWIRKGLRGAVDFWEANGSLIRALDHASWENDRLHALFRDRIGLPLVGRTAEAIVRDQGKGWIGPMDARKMSVALNSFNMTYLNDRFGNPRRRSKATDKEETLKILERVWTAALYGKVANPRLKRTPRSGSRL